MKLTPPERYARKYCTPVVFARFVCALLDFCAHNFPAKPEKNSGHLSLTKGCISTNF